jgi:hypothetical protein
MKIDPEYGAIEGAEIGEVVWDDLTRRNARILAKTYDEHGNLGYWLDCERAEMERTGGGRFPWEISPPR